MIKQSFGSDSIDQLMASAGIGDVFATNTEKLVQFAGPFFENLPGFVARVNETADLAAMEAAAQRITAQASDILLFGTGGSSLGAQAALVAGRYGQEIGPVIHTPDSLDPFEMTRLIEKLNPLTTHVLAISKSGTTPETLAQLLVARSWLDQSIPQARIGEHFTFVTEPGERALRSYGEKLGSTILDHPTDVGGRYSVLTVVGMLPMMLKGLSVEGFRAGATAVIDSVRENPASSIPLVGAAFIQTLAQEKGMQETLLMAYADCMRAFTRWHGQLWAESLGKDGTGITPIRAVGPVDQHSQLQLFLDGPNNRSVTLITLPSLGEGPSIDGAAANALGLSYLADRTIGDMVTSQGQATGNALRARGRFVRDLIIPDLSEETFGALFMSYMLETVFTAELMGVDAFDQPAVEDGKILTRQYLSDLG